MSSLPFLRHHQSLNLSVSWTVAQNTPSNLDFTWRWSRDCLKESKYMDINMISFPVNVNRKEDPRLLSYESYQEWYLHGSFTPVISKSLTTDGGSERLIEARTIKDYRRWCKVELLLSPRSERLIVPNIDQVPHSVTVSNLDSVLTCFSYSSLSTDLEYFPLPAYP